MTAPDTEAGKPREGSKAFPRLLRGVVVGASFGAVAVLVELMLLIIGKLKAGVATPGLAMLMSIGIEVALGAFLGAITSPILVVRKQTTLLHVLAVTAGWSLLGLLGGMPEVTMFRVLLIVPWIVTPPLVLLGVFAARKSIYIPFVTGGVILAGLLALPEIAAGFRAPEVPAESEVDARDGAPDVVLVVLDTVRADHVGAYGYGRGTTPHLDALAAEGARFADATAPATWSLPSHASLFTGRYVSSHGAHDEHRVLDTRAVTLAEAFFEAGYDTRCFTANAWITDSLGLTRGFAWSDEAWQSGDMQLTRLYGFRLLDRLGFGATDKGGEQVIGHFETWARETPTTGRPSFTFVNLIEAHFPYHQVPDEYLARYTDRDRRALRALSLTLMEAQFGGEPPGADTVEAATDMYDAGVAYVDALLGRLIEAVRRRGNLDNTIFVVLADHGELLREHGGTFGHGNSVYETEIRVPLVVRFPSRVAARTVIAQPVSTTAVMATILDLADLEVPDTVQAPSLIGAIEGGAAGSPVISERYSGTAATARAPSVERDPLMRTDLRYRAYRSHEMKLVMASDGSRWLFDVEADPLERHDLAAERPDEVARLFGELTGWATRLSLPSIGAPIDPAEAPELDEATRERLRELGYLE